MVTIAGSRVPFSTPSGDSGSCAPPSATPLNRLTVLDRSHRFVFLIADVPVRLYRGSADEATCRTLRRQAVEVQQLTLTLGEEQTESLVFEQHLSPRPLQACSASCS